MSELVLEPTTPLVCFAPKYAADIKRVQVHCSNLFHRDIPGNQERDVYLDQFPLLESITVHAAEFVPLDPAVTARQFSNAMVAFSLRRWVRYSFEEVEDPPTHRFVGHLIVETDYVPVLRMSLRMRDMLSHLVYPDGGKPPLHVGTLQLYNLCPGSMAFPHAALADVRMTVDRVEFCVRAGDPMPLPLSSLVQPFLQANLRGGVALPTVIVHVQGAWFSKNDRLWMDRIVLDMVECNSMDDEQVGIWCPSCKWGESWRTAAQLRRQPH